MTFGKNKYYYLSFSPLQLKGVLDDKVGTLLHLIHLCCLSRKKKTIHLRDLAEKLANASQTTQLRSQSMISGSCLWHRQWLQLTDRALTPIFSFTLPCLSPSPLSPFISDYSEVLVALRVQPLISSSPLLHWWNNVSWQSTRLRPPRGINSCDW